MQEGFSSDYVCPKDSLSAEFKEMAYNDQIKDKEERAGLMSCYCAASIAKDPKGIFDVNFSEFTSDGQPEDPKYCYSWLENQVIQNGLVIGASVLITVINVVACMIFEMIAKFERKHTINEETISQFSKITIIQFINVALIVICVNFSFLDDPFLGFIPIFNGEYTDFSVKWYSNVGKTLCMTLMINIFSPHASKLSLPFLKFFFRWADRGYSSTFRVGENGVNTKKYLQDELNTLYTGDQISGHYVYAQNYTYLWCVLMFSTGMPILYPFAVIFYFGLYWVYKLLLTKFYQKTTKFNYNLPIYTTQFIKIGVFFHIIVGAFMVTNNDIIPSKLDSSALTSYLGESESEIEEGFAFAKRFFASE